MHILILEDEKPAFKKILKYVSDYYKEQFTYKHLETVLEATNELKTNTNYDLILSDIELLDGNVFTVYKSLEKTPPIIFCTAYNKYLIKAFKVNGISYILKPYSQDELNSALSKYQDLVAFSTLKNPTMLTTLQHLISDTNIYYKKRFTIKKSNGIKLLETKHICFIEAYGDFSKIMDTSGNMHLLSKSIGIVLNDLDPQLFFRVNRSYIVNINYIETLKPYSKNRLSIKMKGFSNLITTSTAVTKEFRKWVEK